MKMNKKMIVAKMKVMMLLDAVKTKAMHKEEGIDGILVTVGLCIIALLLCVVMKDSLSTFITGIVNSLSNAANNILSGVGIS